MSRYTVPRRAAAAIVAALLMPVVQAWSGETNGSDSRLLFDPAFLGNGSMAYSRDLPPPPSATGADAAPSADPAGKAGTSAGAPAMSRLNRAVAAPKPAAKSEPDVDRKKPALLEPEPFGRIAGNKNFSLGFETETKFKPYELPDGQKFQMLDSQRQLGKNRYLGLSLTSPLP